jgi:hypothetical protein
VGSSGVESSDGRRQGAADGNELTRKAGDRSGERHGTEDDRLIGLGVGRWGRGAMVIAVGVVGDRDWSGGRGWDRIWKFRSEGKVDGMEVGWMGLRVSSVRREEKESGSWIGMAGQ